MMERALTAACVAVTTATTDDDGPRRHLSAESQPGKANGAVRFYARKRFDFYKVAPGLLPWLWAHVREFDVVHIHALFSFTSIAAGLIAYWRGVPYVIRPLGTLTTYGVSQRRRWIKGLSLALVEGRILRNAAAVHFTSQSEWDEAKRLEIPFRGVVIPLGVEAEIRGDAANLLTVYPRLHGCRVVLYLSRLDPKKNIEGLLAAFAALNPQVANAVLLVAGSGELAYVAALKTLAESLDIARHVIWLDHIGGASKAAAMAAADVFVLPSFSENFGIAAAEALLSGLPCVLARGVAIAHEVQAVGAGLAVEPEAGAIARALAELLSDEKRRRAMGERARQFSEAEYSPQIMAQRLTALYKEIASNRGLRAA
jgi:glycosyltransferase involved in cell wall biosynthesis